MTREIDAFADRYVPLARIVSDLALEHARLDAMVGARMTALEASAAEIGQVIRRLRAAGAEGRRFADFQRHPAMHRPIEGLVATLTELGRELPELERIARDAATVRRSLRRLEAELAREIGARRRRERDAVFSVDALGLPELETLYGRVFAARETAARMTREMWPSFTHLKRRIEARITGEIREEGFDPSVSAVSRPILGIGDRPSFSAV